MISRNLQSKIVSLSQKLPVVTITGPRQAGKTTLAKASFPNYPHANLEFLDTREYATQDPRGFLASFPDGVILDEIQNTPSLLSYIQGIVDENERMGRFVLTGSQNLLLLQSVSQSLAGRTAMLHLLPLSLQELFAAHYPIESYEQWIFRGFYPRLYDRQLSPGEWLPAYVETYIERDVRNVVNVSDLSLFRTFLRLCAGRIGQVVNLTALGNDIGIDQKTVRRWLSVLETTFTVFLLQPYYRNFNKRITKSPKLYFHDTGLACYLLGIRSSNELNNHYAKGALFENLIISELIKGDLNRAVRPEYYFWRDSNGHEIDCLTETKGKIRAIEMKSGRTVASDFFDGIRFLESSAGELFGEGFVIYGGDSRQKRKEARVLPWHEAVGSGLLFP